MGSFGSGEFWGLTICDLPPLLMGVITLLMRFSHMSLVPVFSVVFEFTKSAACVVWIFRIRYGNSWIEYRCCSEWVQLHFVRVSKVDAI